MIDVGRLNKRITIQEKSEVETDYGTKIIWIDKLSCWASVEPVSGREMREALKISNEESYKVLTRYFANISPDMRILYGSRIFDINGVIDFDERHETLQFVCTEEIENE